MKFGPAHTSSLVEILQWRRDVRHFASTPIGEEMLDLLKQAMDLAPSVGNSRPWRVVAVESPAARGAIVANYEAAKHQAGQIYEDERREAYCALKLAGLREAPVQLAVFTDLDPAEGLGLGRQTMPETLHHSTVLAVHSLWLVARSLNLGVGWVSILDPKAVGCVLEVPSSWELTAYLCIGYPEFDDDTPELERVGWQESVALEWQTK